ncbi:hypothetical protein Pmani_036206 [Petrolisthes manimaculis]|uniref:BZIP domain-containing protein n=1 Tax=Petrolisthes manimaculis TaxID=1843537 RepID=A0AAE1NKN1_9EUCA|nr:hypothetical protein Pmani_036206 [Petrolisthes manimaculis]
MESSGSDGYRTSDQGDSGDTPEDLTSRMRRRGNAMAAKKCREKKKKKLAAERAQRRAEPIIRERMSLAQLHIDRQLDQATKTSQQLQQRGSHYEQLIQVNEGLVREEKRNLLDKLKEVEDYASTLPDSHKAKSLLYKVVADQRVKFGRRLEYDL